MQLVNVTTIAGHSTPSSDGAALVLHKQQLYLFGGRDASGTPCGHLHLLDLQRPNPSWAHVRQGGDVPSPRYGHNMLIWGEQLWVFDGYGAVLERGAPSSPLADLRRFEFLSNSWTLVEQKGVLPQRTAPASPRGQRYHGWHRTVTYGPFMLAFGIEFQDENRPPPAAAAAPRSPSLVDHHVLALHAFDFCTAIWSWVPTQGAPCFTHLEGLFVHGHRLIAIGWAPSAVVMPPLLSPSPSGRPPPPLSPSAGSRMQVSVIDLSNHGTGQVQWESPPWPSTPTAKRPRVGEGTEGDQRAGDRQEGQRAGDRPGGPTAAMPCGGSSAGDKAPGQHRPDEGQARKHGRGVVKRDGQQEAQHKEQQKGLQDGSQKGQPQVQKPVDDVTAAGRGQGNHRGTAGPEQEKKQDGRQGRGDTGGGDQQQRMKVSSGGGGGGGSCGVEQGLVPPPATTRAAMALCDGHVVMHGGVLCCEGHGGAPAGQLAGAEMYVLDAETLTWTIVPPAGAAGGTAGGAAMDGAGGQGAGGIAARVTARRSPQAVSAAGATAASVAEPPAVPRYSHAACYCPNTSTLYLVAGSSGGGFAKSSVTEAVKLRVRPLQVASPASHPPAEQQQDVRPPAPPLNASASAANLAADLREFCCSEWMSDVKLVVQEQQIPAHRIVLCAASAKFKQLIQPLTSSDEATMQLKVDDVEPHVMRQLLEYVYGRQLDDISAKAAPDLFSASHRYGLPLLRDACLQKMLASLEVENVTAFVLLADQLENRQLMEACVAFAAASPERLHQVLSSSGYLRLSEYSARIGQRFLAAAMQRALQLPVTPA